MFQSLGQDPQRQGLYLCHGLRLVGTVAKHAREVGDLGNPAAIHLTFELDLEGHKGTLAPGWLPNKRLHLSVAAVVSSRFEPPRGHRK